MNANELADGLDEDGYHHCADMLRQQQAEIEVNKYGYELDINSKKRERPRNIGKIRSYLEKRKYNNLLRSVLFSKGRIQRNALAKRNALK